MKTNPSFRSELAPVRRALESWRRNRQRRQPIPESLWEQMARLASSYGVNPVAAALGLDYYALKRRSAQREPPPAQAEPPAFLQLPLSLAGPEPGACVAQMEDRHGRKLLVRWSAAPTAQLLQLVQAFWKAGP